MKNSSNKWANGLTGGFQRKKEKKEGGKNREREQKNLSPYGQQLCPNNHKTYCWACSNNDSILGINSEKRCAVKCLREYGSWSCRVLHWEVAKLQEARAEQVRDRPSQELRVHGPAAYSSVVPLEIVAISVVFLLC